jgi:hypothetical protein
LIESIGVSTAATEYRVAAEAMQYATRQMGWDSVPWVNMTTVGKAFFGTGAAVAVYNWFDRSFNEGPASAVNQGP